MADCCWTLFQRHAWRRALSKNSNMSLSFTIERHCIFSFVVLLDRTFAWFPWQFQSLLSVTVHSVPSSGKRASHNTIHISCCCFNFVDTEDLFCLWLEMPSTLWSTDMLLSFSKLWFLRHSYACDSSIPLGTPRFPSQCTKEHFSLSHSLLCTD